MSIAVAHDDHHDDGEMLRLLRDAAATFAKRSRRRPVARCATPGRASIRDLEADGRTGWLGILIPENFGGQGLARRDGRRGRGWPSACAGAGRRLRRAGRNVIAAGNEAVKTLLPKIASGDSIIAVALAGRFASARPRSDARRRRRHAARGQAITSILHEADEFLIAAREGAERYCAGSVPRPRACRARRARADRTFASTLTLRTCQGRRRRHRRARRQARPRRRGVDAADHGLCRAVRHHGSALEMTLQYLHPRAVRRRSAASGLAASHRRSLIRRSYRSARSAMPSVR